MTPRQRLTMIVVTLVAALGLSTVGAGAASAAPSAPSATTAAVSAPVTGTFTDAAGGVGTFAGSFSPTRFSARNGDLRATGTLTGTLTDSAGATVGTVTRTVTAPAAVASATCDILDLVLGPLHLDLLGLTVDLNKLNLVINAVSGPGNLLGNLLCAVAGLLDGNPTAPTLAAILNLLLALLGQL